VRASHLRQRPNSVAGGRGESTCVGSRFRLPWLSLGGRGVPSGRPRSIRTVCSSRSMAASSQPQSCAIKPHSMAKAPGSFVAPGPSGHRDWAITVMVLAERIADGFGDDLTPGRPALRRIQPGSRASGQGRGAGYGRWRLGRIPRGRLAAVSISPPGPVPCPRSPGAPSQLTDLNCAERPALSGPQLIFSPVSSGVSSGDGALVGRAPSADAATGRPSTAPGRPESASGRARA
jgi:hypothetical protein